MRTGNVLADLGLSCGWHSTNHPYRAVQRRNGRSPGLEAGESSGPNPAQHVVLYQGTTSVVPKELPQRTGLEPLRIGRNLRHAGLPARNPTHPHEVSSLGAEQS